MTATVHYLSTHRWFFLLLLATTFAAGCGGADPAPTSAGRHQAENAPVQAEAFVAKRRALNERIDVPGTLLPFETTEIRPEIAGRIVAINIPEGKVVARGTLLVKLFDGDLQAQLQKLQVQLSIAEKTSERQHELLKIGGISQQEADLSELAVSNLKADIEVVRVNIVKTRIVAPYTGKLGLRNISNGAYVTTANVLTTISQVNDLKLDFTVPEKYGEQMQTGKTVSFTVAGSDHSYTAGILATESIIEADTRSLRVRALVKGAHEELLPGAFAKVALQPGEQEQPLVIPTQAVIPGARDKQVILYHNGAVAFTVVKTGIRDASFVQITDGLHEGDTVLTTGLLAVKPETHVRLVKIH